MRVPLPTLIAALCLAAGHAFAEGCPASDGWIDTDRPDTTNSSDVVPLGSLQLENGINVASWSDGTRLDATNSRLRLGLGGCTEVLVDLPNYSWSPHAGDPRGFTGFAPAVKYQLPDPWEGFQASIVAGGGLPTGSRSNGGNGYKPYLQIPWSQELGDDGWGVHGQLTETWMPGQNSASLFEGTLSLEKDFGDAYDAFVEYVGDYPNRQEPSQVLNFGGAWRFTRLQQIDFHAGFGFTRQSPSSFIGIGYSIRVDGLFGH